MQKRTWLVVTALTLTTTFGCKIGGDDPAGTSTETAAAELSKSVDFENGELIDGLMPPGTEEDALLSPLASNDAVLPGGDGLMGFTLDNPDVALALIQFEGADDHFEVEISGLGGDAGATDGGTPDRTVELPFSIDPDVCNKLCNTTYEITVKLAVQLQSKKVGKHASTTITLDCREKGDIKLCGKANEPPKDDPKAADASKIVAGFFTLQREVCECGGGGAACAEFAAQEDCVGAAFGDHLAGIKDQLGCMQDFIDDQTTCVEAAACDEAKLARCDFVKNETAQGDGSGGGAVEVACGALPTDLTTAINACGNTDCRSTLPASAICDGARDCDDGSDEQGCSVDPGGPSNFACTDGTILGANRLCDGTTDCGDGVDEMVCNPCDDTRTALYSIYQQCDETIDCEDGRDEVDCEFMCADGNPVSIRVVCNGAEDCADGSDESCSSDQEIPCGDGVNTVPLSKICDAVSDCPNGFDESSCGA
jgi:Low-density lipoprotein receptor domain class A